MATAGMRLCVRVRALMVGSRWWWWVGGRAAEAEVVDVDVAALVATADRLGVKRCRS